MNFTKKQLTENPTLRSKDKEITTDKHIYNIAKSKEGLVNSFLKMLKAASLDCVIQSDVNNPLSNGYKCYSWPINVNDNELSYTNNISLDKKILQFKKSGEHIDPSEDEISNYIESAQDYLPSEEFHLKILDKINVLSQKYFKGLVYQENLSCKKCDSVLPTDLVYIRENIRKYPARRGGSIRKTLKNKNQRKTYKKIYNSNKRKTNIKKINTHKMTMKN
jgi:hypothetical protein